MTSLSVVATYTDATGNAVSKTVTATIAAAQRFPGDPGAGRVLMGLNDTATFDAVQTQVGPLGLRRSYNGTNWGFPWTKVDQDHAAGRIAVSSFKLGSFTADTVPDSAIQTLVDGVVARKPHPIWGWCWHEQEDDFTTAAEAAKIRALNRRLALAMRAGGATNFALVNNAYMCPWTFRTASGRDPRWWHADWKGTTTAGNPAADWYTGTDSLVTLDALDVYCGTSGLASMDPVLTQLDDADNRWASYGYTRRPTVLAEMGVISLPGDTTWGPGRMQDVYDLAVTRNIVGICWWNTGNNAHGDPTTDPGGLRQAKLAALNADPRTVPPS